MWILFKLYNVIISILFPKKCFICHKKDVTICRNCILDFSRSINTTEPFIYSYFSYKDKKVRSILHAIKYFHRKDLLPPIIEATIPELNNIILEKNNCLFIPIPMHQIRKSIRGYNQAEIIASEYSKKLNIPYSTKILYRKKLTTRQVTSKNKNERMKKQKESFVLKNFENTRNKTIILVDDITTTSATLNEARNLFIKNGFQNIIAITLAH